MNPRVWAAVAVVMFPAAAAGCGEAAPKSTTVDANYAVYRTDADRGDAHDLETLHELKHSTASIRITGPRYGLSFEYVFVTPALTGAQASFLDLSDDYDVGVTAGPGRELVIAYAEDGALTREIVREGADPTVALKAGDVDIPVKGLPVLTEAGGLLIASIPAGSEPLLAATELGKTQTLSLRTGDRGGYSPAAYYPLKSGNATLFTPGTGLASTVTAYNAQFDIDARLGAYSFQRGWAAPGHAWLLLTVQHQGRSEPRDTTAWRLELDLGRHLTVKGAGLAAHPLSTKIEVLEIAQGGFNASIDVPEPAGLKDVTFTLTSGGTLVTEAGKRPRTRSITDSSDVTLTLAVER
ncbi:hypothetical protein [Actinoplanes sp. NPDC089786]|uniref:hypothetical protein n=1 Tax=Actinoplanes sp. NPDC089786 TaxID=3155185 RepID=UPI003437784C